MVQTQTAPSSLANSTPTQAFDEAVFTALVRALEDLSRQGVPADHPDVIRLQQLRHEIQSRRKAPMPVSTAAAAGSQTAAMELRRASEDYSLSGNQVATAYPMPHPGQPGAQGYPAESRYSIQPPTEVWQMYIENRQRALMASIPENMPGQSLQHHFENCETAYKLLVQDLFDAVAHFAASIVVPESVVDPLKYFINNTLNTVHLIAACVKAGVKRFIFSSTAMVYGNQDQKPMDESVHLAPDNPYGASKLMSETILRDTAKAHYLSYVVLRYFNVAGADPAGRSGQLSKPATHLIKIAGELVCGKRDAMQIFGTDYDTPDGTCIRDYIHISDLIGAHMVALDHLMDNGAPVIANCGYGTGNSVRDVLASVARVSGSNMNVTEAPRRAGDAIYLVADSGLLKRKLGWVPQHDDLDALVKSALDWEGKFPD